jgi:hypothetical protein
MKSTEFCYWLQGLFELGAPTQLNAEQTDLIKRHLAMVFLHEIDKTYPEGEQTALNELHSGKVKLGGKDPVTGAVMRC